MKSVLLFFVLILTFFAAFAQGEANSLKGVPMKERIFTGGGLGLSFGNTRDFFSVSPVIGYRLTQKLLAGTGVTYRYTNYKLVKPSLKLNDYGVNPFLRFTVYDNIFIQTEFEYLNYEFPVPQTSNETTRKNFNSFLAGGGFIQPIGNSAALFIMALYNFSYRTPAAGKYTPYDSPIIIRAGVNIGNFGF